MKTYKAKSSVTRAAKTLLKKYPEIIGYTAAKLIATGEWCFNVELSTTDIRPELKEIVNQYTLAKPAPAPVETESKTVVVKKVKDLTEDRRKSNITNPCRLVWDIAEKMLAEGFKRKDIIAECEKQGVAFYTARTQYQKYTQAVKASA